MKHNFGERKQNCLDYYAVQAAKNDKLSDVLNNRALDPYSQGSPWTHSLPSMKEICQYLQDQYINVVISELMCPEAYNNFAVL